VSFDITKKKKKLGGGVPSEKGLEAVPGGLPTSAINEKRAAKVRQVF